MHHFRTAGIVADHAESTRARALRKLHLQAGIEVEEAQGQDTAAILDVAHELAPPAVEDGALHDAALDHHWLPRRRFVDREQPRLVVVTQRQVQDQVEWPRDAQLGEQRQGRLAYARWKQGWRARRRIGA